MKKIKDCDSCAKNSYLCDVLHETDKDCPAWESRESLHDGCIECFYYDSPDCEYPCSDCKGMADRDEYNNRFDLFTSYPIYNMKTDPVNHPSHYTQGKIECIDAMESAFGIAKTATYCHINAFKYLWRMEHKNGVEDLKKAVWYLNKEVELLEKKDGETNA